MADYSSMFVDILKNPDYLLGNNQAEEPGLVRFYNAEKARDILRKHMLNNSRIAIHTDVDMDGIGSCYICRNWMLNVSTGWHIDAYINSCKVHGVDKNCIDFFNKNQYDLVLILDSATNHTEFIKGLNCDCVVIDHHELSSDDNADVKDLMSTLSGKTAGGEYCVINSMIDNGVDYQGCDTMSAGLTIYEFLRWLQVEWGLQELTKLLRFYQWAVITLFTDHMNNDTLRNIYYIQLTRTDGVLEPGLMQMLNSASCYPAYLNKSDIGFTLAPLFNRAIRAGYSGLALTLALTQPKQVGGLSVYREVQDEQTKDFDVGANISQYGYVTKDITNTSTHPNYAGLVAMKLLDKYSATSIVYRDIGDGMVGGSFRGAYEDVNYRGILKGMGLYAEGHKSAFGFKFPRNDIDTIMQKLISYERRGSVEDYITAGYIQKRGKHHIDDILDFQRQQYLWKLGYANSILTNNINITVQTSELEYVKVNSKHTFYIYNFNGLELTAFELIETPQAYIYVELQDRLRLYVKNKYVK